MRRLSNDDSKSRTSERAKAAWLRRVGALVVLLGALGLGTTGALAESSSGNGRYIVTFVAGTPTEQQAADIAAAGASDISAIPALSMHAVDASDVAVADLATNPNVAGI